MSDFKVDRDGVRDAASAYDAGSEEMASVSSVIKDPDPLMLGVFLSPMLGFAGPLITNGARELMSGLGKLHTGFAQNLRATAQNYESTEDSAKSQSGTITRMAN